MDLTARKRSDFTREWRRKGGRAGDDKYRRISVAITDVIDNG